MNFQKSVDVIIPVYNGSYTIKATILSVLRQNQNYINRIIIVNDGSTDNTVEIINNINNPKIYLYTTQNKGVSAARNYGIEKSVSYWVAFIDADDVWNSDKIFIQLDIAQKYNVGFVCTSSNNKKKIKSQLLSLFSLCRGNFIATSSVLVKREILESLKPAFSEKMSFAEDYLTWLKCLILTPGYYTSYNLLTYTLSEYPRYKLIEIIKNIIILNFELRKFLDNQKTTFLRRNILILIILISSTISILSIIKRFILSLKNI